MALDLQTAAPEEGAYTITCAFSDEDGTGVTPNNMQWSLFDRNGQIINDNYETTIAAGSLSSSINVTLTGDDLALGDPGKPIRVLLVEATYDSSYGTDLPIKANCKFTIDDFIGVT